MDQDLIPELAQRRPARRLPGQPRSCPYRPGSMTGLGVPAADPAPGEPRAITTIRRAMGAGRQSVITAQNGAFWTWPSQLVARLDTAGYSGGRLDLQQFVLAAPLHVLRLRRPGMLASAGRRRSPARTQIRHCQRRDSHLGGALSRAVPRACAGNAIAGYAPALPAARAPCSAA